MPVRVSVFNLGPPFFFFFFKKKKGTSSLFRRKLFFFSRRGFGIQRGKERKKKKRKERNAGGKKKQPPARKGGVRSEGFSKKRKNGKEKRYSVLLEKNFFFRFVFSRTPFPPFSSPSFFRFPFFSIFPDRLSERLFFEPPRPRIGQDYPPNLSILLSGGKETNGDSLSSGERSGKSSSLESAAPRGVAEL